MIRFLIFLYVNSICVSQYFWKHIYRIRWVNYTFSIWWMSLAWKHSIQVASVLLILLYPWSFISHFYVPFSFILNCYFWSYFDLIFCCVNLLTFYDFLGWLFAQNILLQQMILTVVEYNFLWRNNQNSFQTNI